MQNIQSAMGLDHWEEGDNVPRLHKDSDGYGMFGDKIQVKWILVFNERIGFNNNHVHEFIFLDLMDQYVVSENKIMCMIYTI